MEEKCDFKGLELLFKVHQQNLKSREDCLVAAVHMLMINKGNKCIGTGEAWTEDTSSQASELLPNDWNSNQDVYSMRYLASSGLKFLLKIVKLGNSMLVNVLNVNEEKAAGLSMCIDDYISDNFGDFDGTFRDMDNLGRLFQQEIVHKICTKSSDSNKPTTSEESNRRSRDRRREEDDDGGLEDYANPLFVTDPQRVAFPPVGRGDLDPLGGGFGGGMLFDPSSMFPRGSQPPFGRGGLPRGSVPPGARFDPFGPPIGRRGRGFQPDPDHLPPPGFEDDYIS